MKKLKVINIFGGPGAGKSTTASGLFHEMKMNGESVELIHEYAKDLVWEKRLNVLATDQYYVTAKQNRMLWRLTDHDIEYAITDSPLMLGLFYGGEDYLNGLYPQLIRALWDQYENYNFFITRKKEYVTTGRNQTEEEAKQVDIDLKDMLGRYNVEFQNVSGARSAIDQIYLEILGQRMVDKESE